VLWALLPFAICSAVTVKFSLPPFAPVQPSAGCLGSVAESKTGAVWATPANSFTETQARGHIAKSAAVKFRGSGGTSGLRHSQANAQGHIGVR